MLNATHHGLNATRRGGGYEGSQETRLSCKSQGFFRHAIETGVGASLQKKVIFLRIRERKITRNRGLSQVGGSERKLAKSEEHKHREGSGKVSKKTEKS